MKPSKVKRKAPGGLVDSAPEQAIADTVRNPAAARMLDIDAANFALMQQPRRMAGGGQAQRFDEGGEVNQPSLDQMRYELDRANSPVMQATPRGLVQSAIGTLGGYIDRAGKFVSEAIEPTAERSPVKHFLADMLLAAPLKGMGTALQDYTGTVRETDEDNPVRGVISKDFRNLTTSREPMLDPRVFDIAQFAAPVIKGATKLAGAGVKAITPFATRTDDMVRKLYASGAMPQPGLSIKDVTPKALAPANEQGFYSPTEAAALNVQRRSGSGQAFLNDITKGENVKSDEISAMGLDTFLKGKPNVTAGEVQDYVAKNKMEIGEAKYFDNTDEEAKKLADQYNYEFVRHEGFFDNAEQEFVDYRNLPTKLRQFIDLEKPTKHSTYQLPGGENYREIVLTLPDPKDAMMDQVRALGVTKNKDSITINDILQRGGSDELAEGWQNASKNTYKSSHFDEPNVLSHLRVSDRVTDGKKTLLVDEVQSDMHQAARDARTDTIDELIEGGMPKDEAQASVPKDFGYRLPPEVTAPMDSEYRALVHKNADVVNQGLTPNPQDVQRAQNLERQLMQSDASKIPDAPYKEDWYQLTLRRAIKEAVDGGYDRVALPTGKEVAERFKLSKTFSEIHYSGTNLKAYDLNGNTVVEETGITPLQLKKYIGKEGAKKLLEQPKQGTLRSLVGQELEFGGEGMKKYYDEIYPTYLKKFGKKYGSQSGMTTVDAGGALEPLHYMEITPAMRKEFSTGIHMKRGGKVHFASNLDAMRQELTQRR